jgi:pyruvate/2-oxoglutarate dehydrogenase complex dihydrolipoamide acyltransferase (E2) component
MKYMKDVEQVNLNHKEILVPIVRRGVMDLLWAGQRKHVVHGFGEVDVTLPRSIMKKYREKTGETLSFTAFIIKCLGQSVDENKYMHACRNGKNRLVLFDEVDVSTIIERDNADMHGKKMPMSWVLRAVNKKSYQDICKEIRNAQTVDITKGAKADRNKMYAKLPTVIRHGFWKKIERDAMYRKKMMGTCGLTALTVTVGGVYEKPCVREGKIEIGEFLCITISLDHDLIDGGPATRFIARFRELLRTGYGLSEYTSSI